MRRIGSSHWPGRQRGLALMVLLALFATAASYMLVSSLNRGSVAMSLARAEKNRAVMQQAKDALIAYAASETLQGGSASFRPGRLPCPDRTNNGNAAGACAGVNRLGRLPYNTLGIAPLYDASGELLWYAVSDNFKTGAGVLNADTQGTLTVSGLAPAAFAVAVILAPGARLGSQDRSAAGVNTATNYLEGLNGDANYDDYTAAIENVTDSVAANLFNDQLLVITQQDVMTAVEPVVAARIQRDIVLQYLYNPSPGTSNSWADAGGTDKSRYFDAWGRFPFAAPFANPGSLTLSPNYTGQAPVYEGLLPMVSNLSYDWSPGTIVKTGGSGNVSNASCAATTAVTLSCSMTWTGFFSAPQFRMYGTAAGVGFSFAQLTKISDLNTPGVSISARTITGSLDSAGGGRVTIDATMPFNFFFFNPKTVTITVPNLITSPLIAGGDPDAGWFNTDQWYKQVYYAVSAGYAPGGAGFCTAGTNCLTVNNLNATTTNDKGATMILAGRSLAGANRPNATIGDYLESQNVSTVDGVFEHGLGKTSATGAAINDKAIVIAP